VNPIVIVGTGLAGNTTGQEFRKHDTRRPPQLITADDGHLDCRPAPSSAVVDEMALAANPAARRWCAAPTGRQRKNPATSGRVQVARTHAGGVNRSKRIDTGSLPPAVIDRIPVLGFGPETAGGNEIAVSDPRGGTPRTEPRMPQRKRRSASLVE
jgi:hypothetical protein